MIMSRMPSMHSSAFVIGWLVFLSGVLAAATVALGFAGYFSALTSIPVLISAIVLLIVLTALLAYGVKETARVAVIATLIEVAGLVIIIAIGLPHLGSVNYWEMPQGYSGLFAASALIFFAYQGFESMVKFSEETKKPETTVPKALILALTISVILYVLVAISVVSVIGWQQLAVSNAPFADVVSASLGPNAAVIIAIVALFATANTALMSMYASSRILYGMAGSSDVTARLAWVHPVRRTPWIAIIICGVLSGMLIFAGDIAFIANVTNFTLFLTFIVINAAVIVLRVPFPPDYPSFSNSLLHRQIASGSFCRDYFLYFPACCTGSGSTYPWCCAHRSRRCTHGHHRTLCFDEGLASQTADLLRG